MYHFCYKTTNKLNGKFYFGKHSTEDLNDGYLGSGDGLLMAIKKYGKDNFEREILQFFLTDKGAYAYEETLIEEWMIKSDQCYNQKGGGDGPGSGRKNARYGKKHAPETILKMSRSHLGRKHSESAKDKISKAHRGKKLSEDHVNKISVGNQGKRVEEETKNKIRAALTGVPHTEERKRNISAALSGDNNPNLGKRHTEETKAKMSASMKGNTNSLGKVHEDSTKERMRAAALIQPKYSCQHCGASMTLGLLNRWHGNNCKKITP